MKSLIKFYFRLSKVSLLPYARAKKSFVVSRSFSVCVTLLDARRRQPSSSKAEIMAMKMEDLCSSSQKCCWSSIRQWSGLERKTNLAGSLLGFTAVDVASGIWASIARTVSSRIVDPSTVMVGGLKVQETQRFGILKVQCVFDRMIEVLNRYGKSLVYRNNYVKTPMWWERKKKNRKTDVSRIIFSCKTQRCC